MAETPDSGPSRRLRYETRDWCRAVNPALYDRLSAHRTPVQHHPEVWDDAE